MKVFHNIFVLLFYGASLISGGAFFYRLHKERRSMWIGTLLSLFLLSLFSSSTLFRASKYSEKRESSFTTFCLQPSLQDFFLYLLFSANHFFPWNSSFGSAFYCACSQSFLPSVFGCHVRLFIRIEPDTPSGKSKFPLYHRTWLRNSRGENDTPPSESCGQRHFPA